MALTFHDVMATDLSTLQTASEEWKAMGDKFNTLKTEYDTHVRSALSSGNWKGHGYNAAVKSGTITAHELYAAKREAHKVAEHLAEAYRELTRLKNALKDLVHDAREAGYHVDATGGVTTDWEARKWKDMAPEELRAYKKDPSAVLADEQRWADKLKRQVKEIDKADFGYRIALEQVTKDVDGKGVKGGFNGAAKGDPEWYEGKRAEQLSSRLANGEDLSKEEIAELRILLSGNEKDRVFSRTLLNGLGAENTVKLADNLRDMGKGGDTMERSLSVSLATATRVPGKLDNVPVTSKKYQEWLHSKEGAFNREFLRELKRVGAHNFGSKTEPRYGYQSFVTLMQQGGKFDGSFLQSLGDDIIETEKKNPGRWDIWNGKPGGKNLEHDPLDGVLGLMSNDPQASTAYLDPRESDRLHYLLKKREWPDYVLNGPGAAPIEMAEMSDFSNRRGFGAALEAAATGNPPGTEHPLGGHSEAEARIMHYATTHLGEKIPQNLQLPMGHILADYTPDTHEILSEANPAYANDLHLERGVFKDSHGNIRVAISPEVLDRVMRGVADDPEAFADMFTAERQYSADSLVNVPVKGSTHDIDRRDEAIMGVGNVFGHYDGVLTDVALDKRDASVQWARDVNHHVNSANATVNFVPSKYATVGVPGVDAVGRIVDFGLYDWSKDAISEANKVGGEESAEAFNTGKRQMDALVLKWVEAQGGDPGIESGEPDPEVGVLQHIGKGKHTDGWEAAKVNLNRSD